MMVLLAACLAAAPAGAGAAWTGSPRVTVELVSEGDAVAPGKTFWIGLRQTIAPGWHTYWINPGDSGEPPQIDWALPAGFSAGDIAWPHPERIRVGPAMSYGYSNEVVLPIPVTAPADLVPGARVTLSGRASWLVCEKECIPEEAPVSLTLAVAAGEPGRIRPGRRSSRGRDGLALAEPVARVLHGDAGDGHLHRGRARPRPRAHRRGVVLSRSLGRHRSRGAPAGAGRRPRDHGRGGAGTAPRGDGRAHRRRARADRAARRRHRAPGLHAPGRRPAPPRRRAWRCCRRWPSRWPAASC